MFHVTELFTLVSAVFFRMYHRLILPLRYSISLTGSKNIESRKTDPQGGILFLSNHPSHLDGSMIATELYKQGGYKISIWTMDFVFKNPYTRIVARHHSTIKLLKVPNIHETRSVKHNKKIRHLIRRTLEGLKGGENILFFPGGQQKHTPFEEISGKSAIEKIIKQYPNVNIVLVRIKGMWGSRFSRGAGKTERSDLKAGSWINFVWKIIKMFALNLIVFIPKRQVTIEFEPAGPDFPRQGTRKEINEYLEKWYNRGYGITGEPLQRVPNYFWKSSYIAHEYTIKSYHFDLEQAPREIVDDVIATVAKYAKIDPKEIDVKMALDRDVCLDSLEITDILIEMEKKYQIPQLAPKRISTVGHLIALAAHLPVRYEAIRGEFPEVQEVPAFGIKAWHVLAGLLASVFGFLDLHR